MLDNFSSFTIFSLGIQVLRKVLKLLKDEFFCDGIQSSITVAQLVISAISILGLFVGLIELQMKLGLAAQSQFRNYLWFTFGITTFLAIVGCVLLQHLRRMSLRIRREHELFNIATKLQHKMVEKVREAAAGGPLYDVPNKLENVLGSQLIQYLRLATGLYEFHVTVKAISGASDGDYTLTDQFRDAEQNNKRPRRESEDLGKNHIYLSFKNATLEDSREIYVCDTTLERVGESLRERSHARGYRSVLAFPLNIPASRQPVPGLTRLIGFLGLDSPEPHAFDSLFKAQKVDAVDTSGRGREHNLDLFYGIADALATILMAQTDPHKQDATNANSDSQPRNG